MASLPYPLNWLDNHGRVGMARMPYPPIDCQAELVDRTWMQNIIKGRVVISTARPFIIFCPINYLA